MSSPWHTEGIPSAIAKVRDKNSLLIVFTTYISQGDTSEDAGNILARLSTKYLEEKTFTSPIVLRAFERHEAVCLRLKGDVNDMDFKNFTAFVPIHEFPSFHIIAPDGRILIERSFFIDAKAMVRSIEYAAKKRNLTPDSPALPEPKPGILLHKPKPLSEKTLKKLKQRSDAIERNAAARTAFMKSKEESEPTLKTSKKGIESTSQDASSTVNRELPPSNTALQLGKRTRLQLRLPDGGTPSRSFSADTTLKEVSVWASEQIGAPQVILSVTYPRRIFDDGDSAKTLSELELIPSATLVVTRKSEGNTEVQQSGSGVIASGGALIRGAVGVAGSFLGSFVGSTPQAGDNTREETQDQEGTERNQQH